MNAPHHDDFSLLVFLEGEMSELEEARVRRHLAECPACAEACRDIEQLDRTLKKTLPSLEAALTDRQLPLGDPFRRRPEGAAPAQRPVSLADETLGEVLAASREAGEVKSRVLAAAAAPEEDLRDALAALDLFTPRDRYGLGYALDEALYSMVEGPARWARLGAASRDTVLPARRSLRAADSPAERAYPLDDLLGLALLVEGTACNWTGDFLRGGRALRRAWGAFGRGSNTERRLAAVELAEAQRRAFLDCAEEALLLAERAKLTFRTLGLEDEEARAGAAHAIALSYLDRDEEAVEEFRQVLPVFASWGRWNAYVSTLNGIGACLLRLGRLDEARREYAKALRGVGREARPAVHAFVRANLARALFEGRRWAEAARAFEAAARLFAFQGATADELSMQLLRVESLARSGSLAVARDVVARVSERVKTLGLVDPDLVASLEAALQGDLPDVDLVETLRSRAQEQIMESLPRAV